MVYAGSEHSGGGPIQFHRHTTITAAVEGSFAAARRASLATKASVRRSVDSPPQGSSNYRSTTQGVCQSLFGGKHVKSPPERNI